jgi:hypothetical protein
VAWLQIGDSGVVGRRVLITEWLVVSGLAGLGCEGHHKKIVRQKGEIICKNGAGKNRGWWLVIRD